jgi:hypothetical protein
VVETRLPSPSPDNRPGRVAFLHACSANRPLFEAAPRQPLQQAHSPRFVVGRGVISAAIACIFKFFRFEA